MIINNKYFYFFLCNTPLNRLDLVRISKDKSLTYLLLKDIVAMPRTLVYFNPFVKNKYKHYVVYSDLDEILSDIKLKLNTEKVVVKMNQGTRSKNRYYCRNEEDIKNALKKIYNRNSQYYDYIAIVQEKIDVFKEFRVIILNKKIKLIYDKKNYEIFCDTSEIYRKISIFINPVFNLLDLCYAGMDIVLSKQNKLFLLEINTSPGFKKFIKHNGDNLIVDLYSEILKCLACD